ncbi:MAG TPA: MBL fold metallo-hydrolase RNA specificity domain-containing protein, partial [archaeon]|nr:MBL fold metallo-hydrolase RNA specificity domain-containing protein [archaeon]
YQAKDSMGWKLQKGLRSFLITDEQGKAKHIDVKMNIVTADAFSGHANRQELLSYINNLKDKPSTIIVNHGNACQDFAKTVSQKFHLNAVAIKNLESVRLR